MVRSWLFLGTGWACTSDVSVVSRQNDKPIREGICHLPCVRGPLFPCVVTTVSPSLGPAVTQRHQRVARIQVGIRLHPVGNIGKAAIGSLPLGQREGDVLAP